MKIFQINLFALSFCLLFSISSSYAQDRERYYYQFKVYHFTDESQRERVDQFLETAYVPALHRAGVERIGVFHTIEDEQPKTYVFLPFASMEEMLSVEETLEKDRKYRNSGKDYLAATHDNAPYERIETILLRAFEGMPQAEEPDLTTPMSERFYELRSYEGPTEALYNNKVDMFNTGDEISIFNRLGFNAVFYGEVLIGSRMPNLMYMTTFKSREHRDQLWQNFSDDSAWNELKSMQEYQNNVSKADLIFLRPAEYSDF
ncbi:NIPSNAP family protein [Porifericola rhodea]|uniref:NIPSNAP family protein n=1 Tax=Porifericola rhodea TaxID=930972 RepID=UPI002666C0A9|nr:NIPSNAP family protein [Porifericola rhodea]WKN32487.1 NIPSNAP family protein [Porifericola rhodea]